MATGGSVTDDRNGLVCIPVTRREGWDMVWWLGLTLRRRNVQEMIFCDVLLFFNFNDDLVCVISLFC